MGYDRAPWPLLVAGASALGVSLVAARSFTQVPPQPVAVQNPSRFAPSSGGTLTPPQPAPVTDGAFVAQADNVAVGAGAPVNVAQLVLKPGQYVLNAKLVGSIMTGPQVALACGLTTQGTWTPQAAGEIDYSSVTIASDSRLPLSLAGTAKPSLPFGTPVYLACRASAGSTVTVRWAKLVATAVTRVM
jgi:hypothetical protein